MRAQRLSGGGPVIIQSLRSPLMRKHLGKARYPAIILLAVALVVLFLQVHSTERAVARASLMVLAPTATELAVTLIRAGLDPEALTAAGVSANATTTLVGNVFDQMLFNPGTLDLADGDYANLKRQCDKLKRVIQSGQATAAQINDYRLARPALAQARTRRQSVLSGLLEAGMAGLSTEQQNALVAIRRNRSWDLSIEFLLADRSEADWVVLRDCLANERIAAKHDEDADPDSQAILAQARSHPAVAPARANLDVNLALVRDAWEQALPPQ